MGMAGCACCKKEEDLCAGAVVAAAATVAGAAIVARAAAAAVCGDVIFCFVLSFVTCRVQTRVHCIAFKCCESLSCINTHSTRIWLSLCFRCLFK